MIVHSNDGVFAIRKGPWKWIEGVPVKGDQSRHPQSTRQRVPAATLQREG